MIPQRIQRLSRRLVPFLPPPWRLPFRATLDLWAGVEPEAGALDRIGPCRGMAIDVGANYGLYSHALAKHYQRVIAFEPNPHASALLTQWGSPKVQLIPIGLSNRAGAATLWVPRNHELELSGWGSLDPGNCPDAKQQTKYAIELRTLDSFEFEDVRFIKIDVEGHELEVLQGGADTITRQKPDLLIEVRSRESEVRDLLSSWGYGGKTLEERIGVRGSPANWIFAAA